MYAALVCLDAELRGPISPLAVYLGKINEQPGDSHCGVRVYPFIRRFADLPHRRSALRSPAMLALAPNEECLVMSLHQRNLHPDLH